jgi:general secretion pathway protein G
MKAQDIRGKSARNLAPGKFARGFTLIELLIVMVIIGVLAVLIFAGVSHTREAARSATCMSNLKQVGGALLMHAAENNNKFIALQGGKNKEGKRPPVWIWQLAAAGYITNWNGKGEAPCGSGVWTCSKCPPNQPSVNYGGFGVVEDAIFVYEENSPTGVSQTGSLKVSQIAEPSYTWLVGDATRSAEDPTIPWYAIWSSPDRWKDHGPAVRHNNKANVCTVDGRVQSLTVEEIKQKKMTTDVLTAGR